jgi:hypothetical protein
MTDKETSYVQDGSRLSKRVLAYLTAEAAKASTQEKLKCVIDPFFHCFLSMARPYAVGLMIVLLLLLGCHGLLLHRVLLLEKHVRL